MIRVHHLNDSRSQRILWLLEELGLPYEITSYQRNEKTRLAPPELKEVHPLGKSPVFEDGSVKIAESGAIVEYLISKHGKGHLGPRRSPRAGRPTSSSLHYAEGSGMLPLMLHLYVMRLGEAGAPLHKRIHAEIPTVWATTSSLPNRATRLSTTPLTPAAAESSAGSAVKAGLLNSDC